MCDHMNSYPGTQVKMLVPFMRRPQIFFTERGTVLEGDKERGEFRMSGDFVAVKAEYSSGMANGLSCFCTDKIHKTTFGFESATPRIESERSNNVDIYSVGFL